MTDTSGTSEVPATGTDPAPAPDSEIPTYQADPVPDAPDPDTQPQSDRGGGDGG